MSDAPRPLAPPSTAPSRIATFAAQATSVGTEVHSVCRQDVSILAIEVLAAVQARRVAVESLVCSAFADIPHALARAGVGVAADPTAALGDLDAGISVAAFGIAETGSVALASRTLWDRLVGMLPEIHIVLLRQSQVVTSLDEAAARLTSWNRHGTAPTTMFGTATDHELRPPTSEPDRSDPASIGALNGASPRPYVSLITGPSRTSDIERVLTIGVHGPRALHIVLLSDE